MPFAWLASSLPACLLCLASVLPVANLYLVIADLLQGVSLMRGKDPARMPDQSLSKT